jgi:hypothetical protein
MEALFAIGFLLLVGLWRVLIAIPRVRSRFPGRWRPVFWILMAASLVAWLFFVKMIHEIDKQP